MKNTLTILGLLALLAQPALAQNLSPTDSDTGTDTGIKPKSESGNYTRRPSGFEKQRESDSLDTRNGEASGLDNDAETMRNQQNNTENSTNRNVRGYW